MDLMRLKYKRELKDTRARFWFQNQKINVKTIARFWIEKCKIPKKKRILWGLNVLQAIRVASCK